jgi:hypothetical protein
MTPIYEAIQQADEHLKAADLPPYGHLIAAMRGLRLAAKYGVPSSPEALRRIDELLRRAGAV